MLSGVHSGNIRASHIGFNASLNLLAATTPSAIEVTPNECILWVISPMAKALGISALS